MRLCLINPNNPLVSLANVKESRWNRYRIWKPLGLLVLAGLTPPPRPEHPKPDTTVQPKPPKSDAPDHTKAPETPAAPEAPKK